MARPQKEGLEYFSLDVDFFSDRKIKILKGRFGADGVTFYLYLLCEIYKGHGYYLKADEDFDYITSSELGMSPEKIGQMRKFLLERSLFDNKLFQSDTILTSTSIQRRFQLAVKSRASKNPIVVNEKFWLLSKEETQSFIKMHSVLNNSEKNRSYSEKNPDYSEIHTIKKRKENTTTTATTDECGGLLGFCEANLSISESLIRDEIEAYLQRGVKPDLIETAIKEAASSGSPNWKYTKAILERCLREGITTSEQFRQSIRPASVKQRARRKEESNTSALDFEAMQRYITYGGQHEKEKKTM